MRVLIAPDCFTGTLTAVQAADAIAQGWHEGAAHDDVATLALSDGGPGFVEVLAAHLGGEELVVPVLDPLRREVPATVLLVDDPGTGARTAYLESAQACGLHLLAPSERDPRVTTTAGVGQLLVAARDAGATRIVVGLGGSGTNDAGAGLLAALGAGSEPLLGHGGLALTGVTSADLGGLAAVREEWAGIEIVAASDVDSPLLGLQGATAVFGPQKGATPEVAQALENALGHFSDLVNRVCPPPTDLLSGRAMRVDRQPGAGAAGGLGYALMLLGARRVSGVGAALEATGFGALLEQADLVVTGEGSFDHQSLRGKVVAGVADAALRLGVPTIVVAGQVKVGRREAMAVGISGSYAVVEQPDRPGQLEAAMADPHGSLARRAARVAATWSPSRPVSEEKRMLGE